VAGPSFVVVDAFVGDGLDGNPAGVVILSKPVEERWLQRVAAEINHAETAFLLPHRDGELDLRWFTPVTEVDLCGHATLAAAHHLWERGARDEALRFHTLSGVLTARRAQALIELDFPRLPASPTTPPDALSSVLRGAAPRWFGQAGTEEASGGNYLAVLEDEAAVRALRPDLGALEALPGGGLIVTAEAAAGTDADIVSRYFAPRAGIPEDHVTGAAHCTLGPYWRAVLGDEIDALQASPRGGRLRVRTGTERVLLEGQARTALSGQILV
jgi:predicted PhzF superfamily epimerase YddE/YHI9